MAGSNPKDIMQNRIYSLASLHRGGGTLLLLPAPQLRLSAPNPIKDPNTRGGRQLGCVPEPQCLPAGQGSGSGRKRGGTGIG